MIDKDIKIECVCDECGAEFEIRINEEFDEDPVYCPFCGSELPEEEDEDDEEPYIEELDFEDN
jgi:rRNA maturation endonuclease Nob1